MRWKILFGLLSLASMLTSQACFAQTQKVVVGGKDFTEQRLLAEITGDYLKSKGFSVDLRTDMGSGLVRQAQENGQIDLYWEYVGTSLISYNKIKETLGPADAFNRVKELDDKKGIVWLNPSKANNTFALAIRSQDKDRLKLATISDLAEALKAGKELTLAGGIQFVSRQDGLPGLEKAYGFKYPKALIKQVDTGLTYQVLRDGQVDLGTVYETDGRVGAFNLLVLEDDKGFFPSYAMVPVIRKDILGKYPKLAEYLNTLSAKFDNTLMRKLNARVDTEKKPLEEVAHNFLVAEGLL
jgi:osmoprotectant transport system substrate-binding protein